MDSVLYSWASPQEDEFALLALGAPSPYEVLLLPSLMRDPKSLLDLSARSVTDQNRWCSSLGYFLQLLTVQQAKTMVLKSPSHGFRLSKLRTLFPQARYIIIERNPYEVFASNLNLWNTLLGLYSLEHFSLSEIEEFVLAAYLLHERALGDGVQGIGQRLVTRVLFEDLVAEPLTQIARIYAELELGAFGEVRPAIERHLASVAGHKRNRLSLSLSQKDRVEQTWGELIRRKGYCWPSETLSVAS